MFDRRAVADLRFYYFLLQHLLPIAFAARFAKAVIDVLQPQRQLFPPRSA
jgi:hypothetical protein